jgi:hypothetical protein
MDADTNEPVEAVGGSRPKGRILDLMTAIPRGIAAAYRDVFADRRVAFASPAVAAVGGLIFFYGIGFFFSTGYGVQSYTVPAHGTAIFVGLVLAVLGMLAGIGIAWSRLDSPLDRAPTQDPSTQTRDRWLLVGDRWLLTLAALLTTVGIAAQILYLIRIGNVPILMSYVEQGRVEASIHGGSALRVLSLLAMPGTWLLTAVAASRGSRRMLAVALGAILIVACLHLATANRANDFLTVEVGILVALLAMGLHRLRLRALMAVAGIVAVLVLAAGVVGAYRLAHSPDTWSDPDVAQAEQANDYVRLTGFALRLYLIVPVQNTDYAMDAVPEHLSWRLGYTYMQPLLTVLPGHQTTFDQDIKTALNQTYPGGGTVPTFLGESYANFGPPGWFAVPLVLGFLLVWLYRRALARNDPAWWTLYAYAIVAVVNANLGGLSVASIFPVMGLVVLIFAIAGKPLMRAATQRLR